MADQTAESHEKKKRIIDLFPFWGYGAVFTAALGVAGCVLIMIQADDSLKDHWRVSPAVLLSIVVAAINISLHLAHTEGLNVLWWRRAATHGSEDVLHQSWERADSLLSAMFSLHRFDIISLATIFVALAPIAGPFLQRSVTPYNDYAEVKNILYNISVAESIPQGYSGRLSSGLKIPNHISQRLNTVLRDSRQLDTAWISQSTGCRGYCNNTMSAPGFSVECSNYTVPYDLTPGARQNDSTGQESRIPIFGTSFDFNTSNPTVIRINTLYKNGTSCQGELIVMNCTLTAATIDYNITTMIKNANANDGEIAEQIYMEYPSDMSILKRSDSRLVTLDLELEKSGRTTYGGFWLALKNEFDASAYSYPNGNGSYDMEVNGYLAESSLIFPESMDEYSGIPLDDDGYQLCEMTWEDPMDQILYWIHNLMFTVSTEIVHFNQDLAKIWTPRTDDWRTVVRYRSNYKFLAAALVFSGLGVLCVLPLFHKFWELQHWSTMNPVDTARFFNSRAASQSSVSKTSEDEKTFVVREVEVREVR